MKELSAEELKERELFVLEQFDKICRENGIEYTTCGGTLLGTVRHQGFIPWDDDVDVAMERADYNRLREILGRQELAISFLDVENNPYTIYPYAKICDKETVLYENGFRTVPGLGVNIDLFPLDEFPENPKAQRRFARKNRFAWKMITHSAKTKRTKGKNVRANIKCFFAFYLARVFYPLPKAIQRLQKNAQKYNGQNTGYKAFCGDKKPYLAKWFAEMVDMPFEHITVRAVKDYHALLTFFFGDYMQFPPKEEQVAKHNFTAYWKD